MKSLSVLTSAVVEVVFSVRNGSFYSVSSSEHLHLGKGQVFVRLLDLDNLSLSSSTTDREYVLVGVPVYGTTERVVQVYLHICIS